MTHTLKEIEGLVYTFGDECWNDGMDKLRSPKRDETRQALLSAIRAVVERNEKLERECTVLRGYVPTEKHRGIANAALSEPQS